MGGATLPTLTMIFDKEVMFADKDDFSHVGEVDLVVAGLGVDKNPGPGNPLIVHLTGSGLVPDGNNLYTVVVESTIDDVIWGPEMTVQVGPNSINNQGVSFGLSSVISRKIRLSLTGFTDGVYTAGIVLGVYP